MLYVNKKRSVQIMIRRIVKVMIFAFFFFC